MSELNEFFDSLPKADTTPFDVNDIFKKPEETKPVEEDAVTKSTEEEAPVDENVPFAKNPKIQRFIERQVKKQLEGLKETKSETESFKESVAASQQAGDIPAEWLMAYGDTEESKRAWNLQQKLIDDAVKRAKEEAVNEVQMNFQKQIEAEKQYENFITNSLESIEDTHDVDLTSQAPAAKKLRSEFLELVKNLSPKDSEGNVVGYADFSSTWDIFQSVRQQKEQASASTQQKKAIASRSMMKSNESESYDPSAPKSRLGFDNFDWSSLK